jgi:predicted lipoprotein with Yx(FWY)xxD motif/cytochrome c5
VPHAIRQPHVLLGAVIAVALLLGGAFAAPHLHVATTADGSTYLVDADGRSLYLFLPDDRGESTCYDTCATAWPPLLVEAGEDVAVAEGVVEDLVGYVARQDGSLQVTYAGWPLYTFSSDVEAGDQIGHGRNEVWYLVAADGSAVGLDDHEADEAMTVEDLVAIGSTVFAQICAACHGQRGGGGQGPRLDGNGRLANTSFVVDVVLRGYGYMPALGGQLTDAEVAGALTFVRTAWSNDLGVVTEEEVKQLR